MPEPSAPARIRISPAEHLDLGGVQEYSVDPELHADAREVVHPHTRKTVAA